MGWPSHAPAIWDDRGTQSLAITGLAEHGDGSGQLVAVAEHSVRHTPADGAVRTHSPVGKRIHLLNWWSPFSGFLGDSDGKESACNARDLGLIPGLGRSPGEGNDYPPQYSGLEYSLDLQSIGSQRVRHDWVTFTFTVLRTVGLAWIHCWTWFWVVEWWIMK